MRNLLILFVAMAAFLGGCSGGGSGSSGSASSSGGGGGFTAPPPVTGTTADVVLHFALARTVPTGVHFRFTGLDAAGRVLWGPEDRSRAATVTLTLPVTVTRLRIEYLAGEAVVGTSLLNVVLAPDATVEIREPDFADLEESLTALTVSPASASLAKGTATVLTATGTFSDGTQSDLTASVFWAAETTAVVAVSNQAGSRGRVTALAPGTDRVTAFLAGKQASADLEVTPAALTALAVTPANPVAAPDTDVPLTATGLFTDGTTQDLTATAQWSSASSAVASVSTGGLARAVAPGSAVLTATVGAHSAEAELHVTGVPITGLQIAPTAPSLAKGTLRPLTATATFSDGTTQDVTSSATWTSTDSSVAPVSARGVVTGLAVGTSQVSAEFAGVGDTRTATVTAATLTAVTVSPAHPAVGAGTTQAFTATGTFSDGTTQDLTSTAVFASTDAAVAGLSGAVATGVARGQCGVTATVGGVAGAATLTVTDSPLTALAVTPPAPTAARGTSVAFTATGTYADGTTQDLTSQVTWTASAGTISNAAGSRGVALADSTAGVTAQLGLVQGTATLTVTPAVLVSVAVDPVQPALGVATSRAFTATGTFTDGTTQDLTGAASWTSSNPAVATVAGPSATGVAPGQAEIRATVSGVTGGTVATVIPAALTSLVVTPGSPSAAKGTPLQFVATGVFADGTSQDLTSSVSWTSDDTAVWAFEPSPGRGSGAGVGSTTVRATLGAVSGTTSVTVTSATLVGLQVDPPHPVLVKATGLAFTATGTFSDGTTQDLTGSVAWTSSATGIATVTAAGAATAVSPGQSVIQAQGFGLTATTVLTVRQATLASLTVNPLNPSLAKGTAQQFTCTGGFSDGTTQDLTSQVSWASTNGNVAVSNAAGSKGRALAALVGSAGVSCSLAGVSSNQATVTVTPAVLVSLDLTPKAPNLQAGGSVNLVATGTFSDGTSQDVSGSVNWTSGTPAVATVSPAGAVTAVTAGVSAVTATSGGVSASTNVTVRRASLASLAVSPANPSLVKGLTRQFTAVGTYADGSTEDLTTQVTWSSGNAAVATLSNAAGSRGLASTASSTGTAQVTATLGAVSGSTTLTVTAATLSRVAVTPQAATIVDGTTQAFTATGTFSDGTTQNLTGAASWTSTNTSVATLSSNVATGQSAGATTIRATVAGVQGGTTLTVRAAALLSLAVTPGSPSIQVTATQQFLATGTFSDGSTANLTSLVTWASSNTGVATISNLADAKGLALGLLGGVANVTATLNGVVSPAAVLTVVAAITPAVPVGVDGNPPNGHSNRPDIGSVSGSPLVVFGSGATNLVASDTNTIDDVFAVHAGTARRVLVNGTTQMSIGNPPGPLNDRYRVAQDGGFLVFNTIVSLVASDTNTDTAGATGQDVYRVPITFPGGVLTLGAPVRVSVTAAGGQASGNNCAFGDITADGRYVVFDTNETDFGVTGASRQVFHKDMDTGTLTKVSIVSGGTANANGLCRLGRVSNDGRYVVFVAGTAATSLVGAGDPGGADTNGWADAYVRDVVSATTRRVSLTNAGNQSSVSDYAFPIGVSGNVDISGNGRYVVFASDANDLTAGDNNALPDAFVRDLVNNTTERVSLTDAEAQGVSSGVTNALGVSEAGSISADGRWVVFTTDMTNLDPTSADTNGVLDIYVRDRVTNQTRRVSLGPDRSQGLQTSSGGSISDDGRWITFATASALVGTDTNGFVDVYVVANPLFQ